MKTKALLVGIVLSIFFGFGSCGRQDHFFVLKGPYLGQTLPGIEPEIFAPGLISTHYSQSYVAFLNEALVCVYSAGTERGHETYYTYEKNGRWTAPQRAPFEELQGHPNYTTGPLGRKVYFHSGRPTHPDDNRQDDNIWAIEWTGSSWAEPEVLPAPANSDYGEAYPSATADGTVYFFTWRRPGTRGDDVWVSRCIDGLYQEAERLPWPINTDFIEYDPYIAPDESFLVFGSNRPGGYGNSDNYICFHNEDGSWTPPINLGRPLNSSSYDLCANGTPDGKYFFFISGRKTDVDKGHIGKKSGEEPGEDSDLYWVDFSFIDDLKNTVLTKQNAAGIIKQEYEENGIQSAVETLNKLYSNQKDGTYFSPLELLSLCKNMITEDKTGDADLFVSALYEVLPKDLMIKEGYARLCAMNGRVSKGLKILEELESEDPNFDLSDSLSGLGYLFTLYPDKTEDALSVLQFTVAKFPEDPFAYYSLARVYRQQGDLDSAITSCRKALEIWPSVGDVSQLLERLLQEKEEKKADNQKKESFPVLKGPYLGQKPPGMTPEVFAPGIISVDKYSEFVCIFPPGAEECIFDRYGDDEYQNGAIFTTRIENGKWIKPEIHELFEKFDEVFLPTLSPDGQCWFFTSKTLPIPEGIQKIIPMYFMKKNGMGWTEPKYITQSIHASVTKDGTVYVNSGREIKPHPYFKAIVDLSEAVPFETGHSVISPDGSYLIFDNRKLPRQGDCRLFVSFKNTEGSWTDPVSLGQYIEQQAFCAWITSDGKYIFFHSQDNRKGNIYWVSTEIIEKIKPEVLK